MIAFVQSGRGSNLLCIDQFEFCFRIILVEIDRELFSAAAQESEQSLTIISFARFDDFLRRRF